MALHVFLCSVGTGPVVKAVESADEFRQCGLLELVLTKIMYMGHLPDFDPETDHESENGFDTEKEFVAVKTASVFCTGFVCISHQWSVMWPTHIQPDLSPPPKRA